MISVKALHDELDHWIKIGIGDDIVNLPSQRPEYQPLVQKYKAAEPDPEKRSRVVLAHLRNELEHPWFLRPTFWHLLWLYVSKKTTDYFK